MRQEWRLRELDEISEEFEHDSFAFDSRCGKSQMMDELNQVKFSKHGTNQEQVQSPTSFAKHKFENAE
jgi:hypothetical protein